MNAPPDLSHALQPFLANWPWFLGLLILLVVVKVLGSARFKGWFGERAVSKGLSRLDPTTYYKFHDLYLPRPDGQGTTQLDHVIVSPFGIFVIETKNYRGWIFGSEKQPQWTQQIYRQKNRFQNPLHQNDLHVRALAACLGLPRDVFLPMVFFIGESVFKPPMPANVLNRGLKAWILQHQETRLDAAAIEKALAILRKWTAPPTVKPPPGLMWRRSRGAPHPSKFSSGSTTATPARSSSSPATSPASSWARKQRTTTTSR